VCAPGFESRECASRFRAGMPGGQLFVRREDGSSLALDLSAHGSLTVADVLLFVEVPAGPRLRAPHGCCLSNFPLCRGLLTAAPCACVLPCACRSARATRQARSDWCTRATSWCLSAASPTMRSPPAAFMGGNGLCCHTVLRPVLGPR
jgi:hypothetical protein